LGSKFSLPKFLFNHYQLEWATLSSQMFWHKASVQSKGNVLLREKCIFFRAVAAAIFYCS